MSPEYRIQVKEILSVGHEDGITGDQVMEVVDQTGHIWKLPKGSLCITVKTGKDLLIRTKEDIVSVQETVQEDGKRTIRVSTEEFQKLFER